MEPHDPPVQPGRVLGFERLMFFSDAVFAIAITLLVLDLRLPADARGGFDIGPLVPKLTAFGLSFYVIGRYWLAHHALFEGLASYDRRLLSTNLAFLPFPTTVLAEETPTAGPVIFYTLSLATVGLLLIALALVARRPALMGPGETHGRTASILAGMAAGPLVFVITASAALVIPHQALWLLLLLFPAGWTSDRLGPALQRRIDGDGVEGMR